MIKWLKAAFRAITGRRDDRLTVRRDNRLGDLEAELILLGVEWLERQREIDGLRKAKKRTSHLIEKQKGNTTRRLEIERELGLGCD